MTAYGCKSPICAYRLMRRGAYILKKLFMYYDKKKNIKINQYIQSDLREMCQKYLCPKCFNIIKDAHTFSLCKHTFCKDCITSKCLCGLSSQYYPNMEFNFEVYEAMLEYKPIIENRYNFAKYVQFLNFRITNISATTHFTFGIDIDSIQRNCKPDGKSLSIIEDCGVEEVNKEFRTGLRWPLIVSGKKVKLLIHRTGCVVIMGTRSMFLARKCVEYVLPVIVQYKTSVVITEKPNRLDKPEEYDVTKLHLKKVYIEPTDDLHDELDIDNTEVILSDTESEDDKEEVLDEWIDVHE
jgi:hypothetical protein